MPGQGSIQSLPSGSSECSREPDTKHIISELMKFNRDQYWGKGSKCLICMFPSCITPSSSTGLWSFVYNNPHRSISSRESPKSQRLNLGRLSSVSARSQTISTQYTDDMFWARLPLEYAGPIWIQWLCKGVFVTKKSQQAVLKGRNGEGWSYLCV